MTPLPRGFASRPFAHRGLHDRQQGRVENSASAVLAAVGAGFGVEIDVQLSSDGVAVVFHDDGLDRLTAASDRVRDRTVKELGRIELTGGTDTILPLTGILDLIGDRVPVVVEIKDQSGTLGDTDGTLERAVAAALVSHAGPVAVMSFNPAAVHRMARLAPLVPRGLTTCRFPQADWPGVPPARLARLAAIADYDRVGASFVSHAQADLASERIARLKARGATILCWTVRSAEEARRALRTADAITFEGYLPAPPPG